MVVMKCTILSPQLAERFSTTTGLTLFTLRINMLHRVPFYGILLLQNRRRKPMTAVWVPHHRTDVPISNKLVVYFFSMKLFSNRGTMMGIPEFRHDIGEHQIYPGCHIERTPSLTAWGDIGYHP